MQKVTAQYNENSTKNGNSLDITSVYCGEEPHIEENIKKENKDCCRNV